MSAMSAVLPLKAHGRRYIGDPGRCRILLTSLATFAPNDLFEDIFVVVPARERAHAEALRRDWQSLPLVVIDEEEILPSFRDHPLTLNAGWYRQQIVKLYAANLTKTEFFITFDSDVILTKPICAAEIVRDGKALLEPEDRSIHSRWWIGSGDILGVPVDLSAAGMAVTPAILSRTICRQLFQRLEDRSQQAWVDLLLRRSLDNLLLNRACDNWSVLRLLDKGKTGPFNTLFVMRPAHGLLPRHHGANDCRIRKREVLPMDGKAMASALLTSFNAWSRSPRRTASCRSCATP